MWTRGELNPLVRAVPERCVRCMFDHGFNPEDHNLASIADRHLQLDEDQKAVLEVPLEVERAGQPIDLHTATFNDAFKAFEAAVGAATVATAATAVAVWATPSRSKAMWLSAAP